MNDSLKSVHQFRNLRLEFVSGDELVSFFSLLVTTMRFCHLTGEQRAFVRYLRTECNLSFREIAERSHVSRSSCQRVSSQPISKPSEEIAKSPGRPRKVDERAMRSLIRCLKVKRASRADVTVKSLVVDSGLSFQMASRRTFSRLLNEKGYGFFQRRKKGLLTEKDRVSRVRFAKAMKTQLLSNQKFWCDEVAFYLDGVSFVHKNNPMRSATASKSRVWRKKGEGLMFTGKGSKDLAGGRRLHVIVAIAHGKGVILSVPYEKMNGQFFAGFIKDHFNLCFGKAGPKLGGKRLFLMDNDPSQTSKVALQSLQDIEAELLRIPPRSPDLNPIENIFHIVKRNLQLEAVSKNIVSESFEEFQARVLDALSRFSGSIIDKTIESMPARIEGVLRKKGYRTRY